MCKVAVIGCGVIGLTSALEIQNRIRNARVTIFTKTLGDKGKAKEAGISLQPIINLSDKKDYKIPDWVNVTLGHSELSRDHLKFVRNGGKILTREIKDFEELSNYDVIVNCTGLCSRDLAGDDRVNPIRGQISRVKAPWQFHTYIVDGDNSCYIIPNVNCVILGGTKTTQSQSGSGRVRHTRYF
ncbi:hypothetical protein NQ317_019483 [Molorchus minor]|uniref:FAD dependent oxidoreductase domain-containing protein n=1 Tax=Molorchus minor TaxID=1323400 RepID=A0ABQ9JQT3_9CUCU|nr:hypothetical protein NQ317_019483 [Molorchus minor]